MGLLAPPSINPPDSLKHAVAVDSDMTWRGAVIEGSPRTLFIVDAYSAQWGTCDALYKKIANVFMDNDRLDMAYVLAKAEHIFALSDQRNKSKPCILLYKGGREVDRVAGAFPLELERKILRNAGKKPDDQY